MSKTVDFKAKLYVDWVNVGGEEIKTVSGKVRGKGKGGFVRFSVSTKEDLAKALSMVLFDAEEV